MDTTDAPGVQTVLGEAGASPVVEWAGRAWKIAHPVQKAKAILEEHVAAEAVREVAALERLLPADTYAKAFRETLSMVGGKFFRTGGPGWVKAVEGADGSVLFLFSLLRVHQPDATVDDARGLLAGKPLETLAALARVAPDFFGAIVSGLPIPEADKPARAAEMAERFLTSMATAFGPPS